MRAQKAGDVGQQRVAARERAVEVKERERALIAQALPPAPAS
jgi:hypothetical protein